MSEPILISSRENALLKELRKLSNDNTAYRKAGRFWIEGDHLCSAALARGVVPSVLAVSESFWPAAPVEYARAAIKTVVIPDALFREISGLESPAKVGFVLDLPEAVSIEPLAATVILDRVQDAGNVGSILRSAGAFGFRQVLALKGSAALWSPKVLRAGMGAHFGLRLIEGLELQDLDPLKVPMVVTSSHQGDLVQKLELPHPCAWAMGHEGQGVSEALMAKASVFARIGQPGGEESLNVAAAAAICLHASSLKLA
ncbi:23S rRNA (uridine(2479)-2'-O)-methyltransferase [Curvibacter sp. AEP1-3]|uniref:TrmH family RNA methyltransferase n=1 Tax=Curvibacter sp. AEP1-3 TaxID=1844971 RepID=UPI000B3CC83A|nr:RNA methyltransferase [Curvibacter sp. AEP1-3]ARV20952.1 23S rRNA (uridine(2479)-2'-O)-methyltransferase [Curvibacter sp. AEP1-3]